MIKCLSSVAVSLLVLAWTSFAQAEGPVDSSKVRKDLTADASGKTYRIATVVKVDGIAWFERMRDRKPDRPGRRRDLPRSHRHGCT